ncbi:MAG: RNA polymerase sigma factor [Algicola sp.]|nr:RNA polymerase sigma factor [Algicola sp.]
MTLEQLIKSCKKRNPQAQLALYNMYKDSLFMCCLKYCKNKEDAQDNLQDAFIEIFTNIHRYSGKGSFEGWIKRITINKAIDKYKKESRFLLVEDDHIFTDTYVDAEDLFKIPLKSILKFIQELPGRYRLIFNMYELDDYSHQEIATQLNISVGTSKSNLHRAKLILKDKITTHSKAQTPNKKAIKNGI